MAERVTITVIIACYNDGQFVPDAVASVRAQDLPGVRIIVTDDGSTDAQTLRVLDELASAGVEVVRNPHRGPSANRNAALDLATGDFIVALDADDQLAPGYLQKAAAILRAHPQVGIVAPGWQLFGAQTGQVRVHFEIGAMLAGNRLIIGSMYRLVDARALGGYCVDLFTHEDWDLWLGILGLGRMVWVLDEPYYRRRIRPGQLSWTMTAATNPPVFAAVMGRHQDLYREHAEAFWRAVLAERAMLAHYKSRYGRLENLIHHGADRARGLKEALARSGARGRAARPTS